MGNMERPAGSVAVLAKSELAGTLLAEDPDSGEAGSDTLTEETDELSESDV